MSSSQTTTIECPICAYVAAERLDLGPVAVHCPVCGRFTYRINEAVDRGAATLPSEVRAFLSTYVREKYEEARLAHGDESYASISWGEAFEWARSRPRNRKPPGTGPMLSADASSDLELRLLTALRARRVRAYSSTVVRWSDYSLFHTDSAESLEALLMHCQREGWIYCVPSATDQRTWHVALTGSGERELAERA